MRSYNEWLKSSYWLLFQLEKYMISITRTVTTAVAVLRLALTTNSIYAQKKPESSKLFRGISLRLLNQKHKMIACIEEIVVPFWIGAK
jgi:hypothetical protein